MGLLNDIFEDSLPGVIVGAVATAILMPLVGGRTATATGAAAGTAARGRGRPLLKAAVGSYVAIADRIKEATSEAREQLGDLAAEVREEREERRRQAEAPPAPQPQAPRTEPATQG